MRSGQGEPVEVLDTRDGDDGPPSPVSPIAAGVRWPAGVIATLALILAVWLISGENRPAPPRPEPQPPTTPAPQVWEPTGDLLVAAVAGGVLAVDTADGAATVIATPGSPLAVAPGPPGQAFVHYQDGNVEVVDLAERATEPFATGVTWFAPSSNPGRVWLRYGAMPDAIVETDSSHTVHTRVDRSDLPSGDPRFGRDDADRLTLFTDQGTMTLGQRSFVATTPSAVYASSCEDLQCELQRRPADGDGSWAPIVAHPRQTDHVSISADDVWLLSMGANLAVYPVDGVAVKLVHTGAEDALFSADSRLLYVITKSDLEVVDLVGDENRTVALPDLALTGAGWEVVAAPG